MAIINFNSISGVSTISVASSITVGNVAITSTTITAPTFVGNVNSTSGVTTVTTLNATIISGVSTAGITTAYVTSINDGPIAGSRNRIINGDCRVDQRNNGASVTATSGYMYPVDRLRSFVNTTTARWSVQRSGDAPVGFTSSFLLTVTTPQTSFTASELGVVLEQPIEGYNVADLNWGTSSASPITLSFWVKSSVVGSYPASFFNYNGSAIDRSYVTTFSVSQANTWEYKTITVPGDTSGTWLKDNRQGLYIALASAGGSDFQGTSNTWQSGLKEYPSGTVNIFATNGATIRFTGLQLELGTVSTPFERRSYGQELALCYRYYRRYNPTGTTYTALGSGITGNATNISRWGFNLDVPVRSTPTISFINCVGWNGAVGGAISAGSNYSSTNFVDIDLTTSGLTATQGLIAKVLMLSNGYIEITGVEL